MKALRSLILIALIVFCSMPLVIQAQNDDDPVIPEIVPATPGNGIPTEELIEYPSQPTATLDIHPATPGNGIPTEELIEYPFTPVATDPCAPSQAEIEADLILPFLPGDPCFPTATPSPAPTRVTEMPSIINGQWYIKPGSSTYSSSGSCQIDGGDNGGPDNNYGGEDDIPKVPACMTPDTLWLQVSSSGMVRSAPGVYSETEHRREMKTDSNGTTTGSVNVTIIREYRVISPTEIVYSYIRQEEGGCTTTSSVTYVLFQADDMVCVGEIITPEPTLLTPQPTQSTPAPGETLQPTIAPLPPIIPGGYRIELPTDDPACTADRLPPSDEVEISYTSNQDIMIDFGLGSYTLFWDGDNWFEYRDTNLFGISIGTYDGGASLSWHKRTEPGGDNCYVSSPLISKDAPPPTETLEVIEPTSVPDVEASTIAGSSFTTTAEVTEQFCPAEAASSLPDLTTGILTAQADGTFVFSLDGKDYVLTNADGIYAYQEIHDDGSVLQVSMNGFYEGVASGSFALVDSDGYCIAMLTFTPA